MELFFKKILFHNKFVKWYIVNFLVISRSLLRSSNKPEQRNKIKELFESKKNQDHSFSLMLSVSSFIAQSGIFIFPGIGIIFLFSLIDLNSMGNQIFWSCFGFFIISAIGTYVKYRFSLKENLNCKVKKFLTELTDIDLVFYLTLSIIGVVVFV